MKSSELQAYTKLQRLLSALGYHAFTLWLFTVNDFKTMIIPSTLFAFFTCEQMQTSKAMFLHRLPTVVLWTWINLLAFTVNNQRSPSAVTEDRLNKPWRPIPSGRLSTDQARTVGTFAHLLAQASSLLIGGGLIQSVFLSFFGYIYNDLGGGDRGFVIRNALNAIGFTSFASGALEVAAGDKSVLAEPNTMIWLGLIALVVATTVHSQDMYDQEGDAIVGRHTVPLVIGDRPARWSIALAVLFWCAVCPFYWEASVFGYLALFSLGLTVAWRTLVKTTVHQDRTTFRVYNAWLVSIYALPFMANINVSA